MKLIIIHGFLFCGFMLGNNVGKPSVPLAATPINGLKCRWYLPIVAEFKNQTTNLRCGRQLPCPYCETMENANISRSYAVLQCSSLDITNAFISEFYCGEKNKSGKGFKCTWTCCESMAVNLTDCQWLNLFDIPSKQLQSKYQREMPAIRSIHWNRQRFEVCSIQADKNLTCQEPIAKLPVRPALCDKSFYNGQCARDSDCCQHDYKTFKFVPVCLKQKKRCICTGPSELCDIPNCCNGRDTCRPQGRCPAGKRYEFCDRNVDESCEKGLMCMPDPMAEKFGGKQAGICN